MKMWENLLEIDVMIAYIYPKWGREIEPTLENHCRFPPSLPWHFQDFLLLPEFTDPSFDRRSQCALDVVNRSWHLQRLIEFTSALSRREMSHSIRNLWALITPTDPNFYERCYITIYIGNIRKMYSKKSQLIGLKTNAIKKIFI